MLKISNLSVSYGVIPVLHGVSMEVKEGEIVALLGSNGAGKTTLLNCISGLLQAKEGSIVFLNEEISGLSPDRIVHLGISQIPEGRKIFPYLTVKENLLMGASISRAWAHRAEMLEHVYGLFPILKERADQRASLMSGGEQQMLVIARGLMARPRLLMIDEPSLGLSPLIMSKIYEVIKTFPQQGITVLLSEQNAHVALEIADRGYVLQDGHIVLQGERDFLLHSELVRQAYMGM
ncbi:MAG TPA: ABC transporter ATP-binding protein [Syntrophales bacterium]|nr:ABC transporter ATP-binding protein [Syntrophales bacterium]HOL60090.1 ABC transporter ATP-binding protein [Syntrophales bacterium]HPO35354.1 ABC transporter ATP-binding protein [Syntrophales bacterium]